MPNIALSEARVKALKSRKSTYDIRDGKLRCFGVRVMPSGAKRFFIHIQHQGERHWKIVGDAKLMHVNEARVRAASMVAAFRRGGDTPASREDTIFEAVAQVVFQRYARGLETPNARRQPDLSAPPDSACVRRTADCRNHPARRAALVRLASGDTGRRRPVHAGPVGHHERGGASRVPPRGVQSLPGHQTVPPQGARAVPVRRGDWPRCGETLGARSRMPGWRSPPCGS